MEKPTYIWLFGENKAETCNNNSFYFWNHVVNKKDNIEKYFILKKTKKNQEFIKSLEPEKRKYIIWQNSFEHYMIYRKADLFIVTLSYLDVSPTKIFKKEIKPKVIKPVIYLQHGTIAMKRLGYNGKSYNNNMFRFFLYNPNIKEQFGKENNFKPYQLYDAKYHPRYQELLARSDKWQKERKENDKKQILWFITWREYLGKNKQTEKLVNNIKYIMNNTKLQDFLEKNNYTLKICVHQFFSPEVLQTAKSRKHNVEIVYPKNIDVMDELVKSDILITDYSSVGFDFTFLNKPVILYQPDLDEYLKNRSFYCTIEELNKYSVKKNVDLIDIILKEDFKINPFFRNGLPNSIDYDYVRQGKHIDRMYDELANIQNNKITFIGYNFYGVGGTVSATKSLAEGLLEKGYMVELLSLKKTKANRLELPCGLNIKNLYVAGSRKKKELIKRLFRTDLWYSYLKYDKNKENLIPYTGFALKNKLKHIKSATVVSTRETLHLFLKDASSPYIKNKLYFFHTDAKVLKEVFPKVMPLLKKVTLENALFVTKTNQEDYKKLYEYNNYENSVVIGNSIESKVTSEIEDVKKGLTIKEPKKKIRGILLTRISIDRTQDMQNIIEFGKYLKEHKHNNIVIDVYGKGDYLEEFKQQIEENEIEQYICYKGLTVNPKTLIINSNFVLDLSENQSFGMIYLEAILNGKMVFCKRNVGSMEVLNKIPECYFENYDELVKKIKKAKSISKEQLVKNYEIVAQNYSREKVAEKFLELVNESEE